jgi:oxygen-independent coproporphyrinogen-3 oxidase
MPEKFNRLYVHVPFCASKCGYCAFYSIPQADNALVDAWLKRLVREFANFADNCTPLKSVFIGGGTPTVLSPELLAALFNGISANFAFSPECETSIECNPETLTTAKADVVAEFAHRVSLGVQSFDSRVLAFLERRGAPADFAAAAAMLSERGLENLGCDLIYAVPGETLDVWRSDLLKAVESGVRHVSCYSLTIEEGSRLNAKLADSKRLETLPGDELELDAEMWETAGAVLAEAGMRRYEISNHALPGFECSHNLGVWLGDAYLGCGPAATSFDGVDRRTNPANLAEWLNGAPPEIDSISPERRAAEVLAMGLRISKGWNAAEFAEKTGFPLDFRKRQIAELADAGLLNVAPDAIAPTTRGMAMWDDIAETIII